MDSTLQLDKIIQKKFPSIITKIESENDFLVIRYFSDNEDGIIIVDTKNKKIVFMLFEIFLP